MLSEFSLWYASFPTLNTCQIIIALLEWRSGAYIPFDTYVLEQRGFVAQKEVVVEILTIYQREFTSEWDQLMANVRTRGLQAFELSRRMPDAPEAVMDWSFSW